MTTAAPPDLTALDDMLSTVRREKDKAVEQQRWIDLDEIRDTEQALVNKRQRLVSEWTAGQ